MMDSSRKPLMAMFSVRGIGVAVSVSRCTSARSAFSASFWRTPMLLPFLDPDRIVAKIMEGVERNHAYVKEPFMVKSVDILRGALPQIRSRRGRDSPTSNGLRLSTRGIGSAFRLRSLPGLPRPAIRLHGYRRMLEPPLQPPR